MLIARISLVSLFWVALVVAQLAFVPTVTPTDTSIGAERTPHAATFGSTFPLGQAQFARREVHS